MSHDPGAGRHRFEPAVQCRGAVVQDLPSIDTLSALTSLVERHGNLYVRWSADPGRDLRSVSRDELTGVELPGLSVSALVVGPWWDSRPLDLWVARRVYDYEHLRRRRPGARPWVLAGRETGRGPDNEPLVTDVKPLAWVSSEAVQEARDLIDGLTSGWGPLERGEART